jgi:hypothetical protein
MLPNFKQYAQTGIFDQNSQVKHIMALFYRDILDLQLEMLRFFSLKGKHCGPTASSSTQLTIADYIGLNMALEAVWPKFRNKLALIQTHLESHKNLMNSNVTLEQFLHAVEHRQYASKKYEEDRVFQLKLQTKELSDLLSSPSCTSRFRSSVDTMSAGSGDWLFCDATFSSWYNPTASSGKCMWVQGIPGAGKCSFRFSAMHWTGEDKP